MIIGHRCNTTEETPLNKWIIFLELLKCPPYMRRTFRPYIRIVCVKFLDLGEPWKIDGRSEKKVGGWWEWYSPIGISIKITR